MGLRLRQCFMFHVAPCRLVFLVVCTLVGVPTLLFLKEVRRLMCSEFMPRDNVRGLIWNDQLYARPRSTVIAYEFILATMSKRTLLKVFSNLTAYFYYWRKFSQGIVSWAKRTVGLYLPSCILLCKLWDASKALLT